MSKRILEKTIFEQSRPGIKGASLPKLDVPEKPKNLPDGMLRDSAIGLPELAEIDVMRHYVRLSTLNHHVDKGFYPLGSCTMKYNPKVNEDAAALSGFTGLHPLVPDSFADGALELMSELGEMLLEIAGHDAITLQPAAGAHGELTGLLVVRAFHEKNGNPRSEIILPDSAHGTNPASIVTAGYKPVQIISKADGLVNLEALKAVLSEKTAAIMLTNPNTVGIFEKEIRQISKMARDVGAQMYMDGANLNAILGMVNPGEIGFDVMHFNLHKSFSTPHGGGGPGSGPLSVKSHLEPFLPTPLVLRDEEGTPYLEYDMPDSIGKVQGFYGNFLVMVKAWVYLRMLGASGLREVAEWAVLNANYILEKLRGTYGLKYTGTPMHECVLDATTLKDYGIKNIDVAKRLLDYGFHAPTMSFPLIVPDALMIEPTETESKETLDAFIATMLKIAQEAKENPDLLHHAPITTPISRLDEGKAARLRILRWPIPEDI
jgi:glycine dehydrogenase subunit 2